ncbi:MAG: DHH family phosphoesterase [Blautia caecimuris]
MNYELIENSLNDINNPVETILKNRGVIDWKQYMKLNDDCIYPYSMLSNMGQAVECMKKHIENKNRIHIIVDSDVDGYTSGSMMYRYLKLVDPKLDITYSLHTAKQHGLSYDIEVPDNCNLLIIPDAGSNDVEQCKELKEKGMDIIILDHHICDKENNFAIIINNQACDYPNKNLCGAGVVYKFLQALDDELWESYADNMLDMVALANISDVMDMREYETRHLVNKGLNKIRSKLFKALIDKQSYSMNGVVNITSVQFYITPILNAMIRIGYQNEKDLLFRAFIETDEIFKYKKRGAAEETDEDIYARAARLCYNAKNRQSKEVTKEVAEVDSVIETQDLNSNKALFINGSDIINESLTGLVAMKVADKYQKPCIILRRRKHIENEPYLYGGSCRNFDNSPVYSLKNELVNTGLFEFVQGHDNAAGVCINRANVVSAIEAVNEQWKDIDFTPKYLVDFDVMMDDIDICFIKEIDDMKDIFGQGIKEPLVHISNIPVYTEDVTLMGKELNSWKIIINDEIAIVKFLVDTSIDPIIREYRKNGENNDVCIGSMDIIGTVSMNNYKGILTPQIIVKDYILKQ